LNAAKVAVTLCAFDIDTTQFPVPLHAPLHPVNPLLALGVATRVTVVPTGYVREQVPLVAPAEIVHEMAGLAPCEATDPDPVPAPATVSANGPTVLNVAVTFWDCVMFTTHAPVPEHAPLQPRKRLFAAGVAVSVMDVPSMYVCEQAPLVLPAETVQLMAGAPPVPVTLPIPEPAPSTVRGNIALKVAVTLRACDIVTEHAPVPVQAPLHPAKTLFAPALATSVTAALLGSCAAHVPVATPPVIVQLIPGAPPCSVTTPAPVPAPATLSVNTTLNVAVTVWACDMVTTQAPVPVHAPPQPVKMLLAPGAALSVTAVPGA
jgi:hypothetical protein